MRIEPRSAHGIAGTRLRATLSAAGVLVALVVLAGCSSAAAPRVTLTVPAAADPGTGDPGTADPGTGDPGDPGSTDTGETKITVSKGAVATACTHSVCNFVHVKWQNLDPGVHATQCVTDYGDLAAWSDGNYNYATADGEQDLQCFLGYSGHVWVVLDGTLASNQVDW